MSIQTYTQHVKIIAYLEIKYNSNTYVMYNIRIYGKANTYANIFFNYTKTIYIRPPKILSK